MAPDVSAERIVTWAGTASQCAGVALLAAHVEASPYAYVPMLAGSALWTAVALTRRDGALIALQGFFFATNLIGIWRWLA